MFTSILQDISVKLVHNAKLISTCVEDSRYNRLLDFLLLFLCPKFVLLILLLFNRKVLRSGPSQSQLHQQKSWQIWRNAGLNLWRWYGHFCTMHSIHIRFVLAMQEKHKSCARGVGRGLLSFSATPLSLPPSYFFCSPLRGSCTFPARLKGNRNDC